MERCSCANQTVDRQNAKKKKKNECKSNIHVNELTNAGNIDAERKKNTVSFAAHELHSRTQTAIADIRQCKKIYKIERKKHRVNVKKIEHTSP